MCLRGGGSTEKILIWDGGGEPTFSNIGRRATEKSDHMCLVGVKRNIRNLGVCCGGGGWVCEDLLD